MDPSATVQVAQPQPCSSAFPGPGTCSPKWHVELERSPPRHDPVHLANHNSWLPQTPASPHMELVIVLCAGLWSSTFACAIPSARKASCLTFSGRDSCPRMLSQASPRPPCSVVCSPCAHLHCSASCHVCTAWLPGSSLARCQTPRAPQRTG